MNVKATQELLDVKVGGHAMMRALLSLLSELLSFKADDWLLKPPTCDHKHTTLLRSNESRGWGWNRSLL